MAVGGKTFRGPSAWGGDGDSTSPPAPADGPYVTTTTDLLLPGATLIGAIILPPDLLANIPLATTVPAGALFFPTNDPSMYRSTGTTWEEIVLQDPLNEAVDSVRSVDAAEDTGVTPVPFTITGTGTTTLVAAAGGGNLLRLRRISPTYAIRSPDSEPILALFVGAIEAQRGNALTGRFDITAGADTDALTLTVDVLDSGGIVAGTVYYELA